MQQYFHINIDYKSRERRILNALLALVTGILTLIYPDFLYLIAAGYLIALAFIFFYGQAQPIVAAIPMITGILIFIFPDVVPIAFAVFLGFFGVILLMIFQFTIMGFLTLLIAILIIANPDSIAYFTAAFLLLYGITNLIKLFQNRGIENARDRKEIGEMFDK